MKGAERTASSLHTLLTRRCHEFFLSLKHQRWIQSITLIRHGVSIPLSRNVRGARHHLNHERRFEFGTQKRIYMKRSFGRTSCGKTDSDVVMCEPLDMATWRGFESPNTLTSYTYHIVVVIINFSVVFVCWMWIWVPHRIDISFDSADRIALWIIEFIFICLYGMYAMYISLRGYDCQNLSQQATWPTVYS